MRAGIALAGIHLAFGLLLYDPTLFPGGDNAGYMILGEALAAGEGYRDLYLPHAPLHTKYPPLYPLLLALLTPVGGLQAFKLASLLLTTAAVWATYRLAERRFGRGVAVPAAGLLALSPALLDYSHYVLSEALFVLLVVTSLLLFERAAQGASERPGGGVVALGLVAAVAAFLTRTAGLPLLAAIVLFALLGRSWRRLAVASAAGAGVAAGWWLYQRLAQRGVATTQAAATYLQEMLLRNPYDPAAGSIGPSDLLLRATENAWTYASVVLPRALVGAGGEGAAAGALLAGAGLLVTALAFGGWARSASQRLGPAELFAGLYALMLILWPTVWTDQRFLLPILPLTLAYALYGAYGIGLGLFGQHDRERWIALPAAVLAAALGLGAVGSAIARVPERIGCLAEYRAGTPCDPPAFASFYAAARWAAESTPGGAVFANRKPRIFYWISGRKGDLYPYTTDQRAVLEGLEELDADYVVVDAISATTQRYLTPAIRENLRLFEVVYEGGNPSTLVLRFERRPLAAD